MAMGGARERGQPTKAIEARARTSGAYGNVKIYGVVRGLLVFVFAWVCYYLFVCLNLLLVLVDRFLLL